MRDVAADVAGRLGKTYAQVLPVSAKAVDDEAAEEEIATVEEAPVEEAPEVAEVVEETSE